MQKQYNNMNINNKHCVFKYLSNKISTRRQESAFPSQDRILQASFHPKSVIRPSRRSEKQDADRSGQDARKPRFPNQKRTRRV